MHHKIHLHAKGATRWLDADPTPVQTGDLTGMLDTVPPGPVTIAADTDIGQDHVALPVAIADLKPRPQVLASGDEAGVWPALIQADPPTYLANSAPLAGFAKLSPDYDGVLCIVTHQTIWLRISAGEACHALVDRTRHLCANGCECPPSDAMRDGFDKTNGRSSRLGAEIAQLDAMDILSPGAPTNDHRLGLALGAEFASAKAYWLGQHVTLLADGDLMPAYSSMLNHVGALVSELSLRQAVFAGLSVGHEL